MSCPDCDGVDRREFLKTAALGAVGLAAARAASRFTGTSETLVTTLYNSLTRGSRRPRLRFPSTIRCARRWTPTG